MDSTTLSILCDEFRHLPVELQNQEIKNLFKLDGGIRIRQNPDETDEEFRTRTFKEGLNNLPDESEYEIEFFKNRIIPSLIEDFKGCSVDRQERLMDKLVELTDGVSVKRESGEFRAGLYSRLLHKIRAGSEFVMVVFARKVTESKKDESTAIISIEVSDHRVVVQSGRWNDGSKKAGFNPELKRKDRSKPNYTHGSNSKLNPRF